MKEKYRMTKAFKIHKILLTITGTWPKENDTLLNKTVLFVWGLLTLTYMIIMYSEPLKPSRDIAVSTNALQLAVPMTSYYFKFVAFVYKKRHFLDFLKFMDNEIFYQQEDKLNAKIERAIKISNTLTIIMCSGGFVYVLFYIASPFWNGANYPTQLTTDFGVFRPLIYFIQVSGVMQGLINNAAFDCLCLSGLILAIVQFNILKYKIENVRQYAIEEIKNSLDYNNESDDNLMFSHKVDKVIERKLKEIVDQHNALIEYIRFFERTFSFGLFVLFFTTTLALTAVGFSLVVTTPTLMEFLRSVTLLMNLTCEVFIYCYFGDRIITESYAIGDACYFSDWYLCNTKVRKMFWFIIHRSQKPVTITLMNFANYSLPLFATLLRTSYSYFALLLQMVNKDES